LKRLVLKEIRACDAAQGSEGETSRTEGNRRSGREARGPNGCGKPMLVRLRIEDKLEIKRHQVELIAKKPYREDVHGLSADLGGTIAQVLDQRFKLQKHIAILKDESGRYDIHTYAVRCIVIAGRSPLDATSMPVSTVTDCRLLSVLQVRLERF
jgi:hypothetical protein